MRLPTEYILILLACWCLNIVKGVSPMSDHYNLCFGTFNYFCQINIIFCSLNRMICIEMFMADHLNQEQTLRRYSKKYCAKQQFLGFMEK